MADRKQELKFKRQMLAALKAKLLDGKARDPSLVANYRETVARLEAELA